MAPSRRKAVGQPRRRVHADEDEAIVGAEDSLSDDSGLSEEEDEEDEEHDSDSFSDAEVHETEVNGKGSKPVVVPAAVEPGKSDTHVMLNGVKGDAGAPELNFEDLGGEDEVKVDGKKERKKRVKTTAPAKEPQVEEEEEEAAPAQEEAPELVVGPGTETLFERRRREHEEYRKKRDADPAFVPNRGAFFMHDSRNGGSGANGFRPFGRGRGRGGPAFGSAAPEPADTKWNHDMHDTVAMAERERERLREIRERTAQQNANNYAMNRPHNNNGPVNRAPIPRKFDSTVTKGMVPIKISIPGMTEVKSIPDFVVKIYTRLPNHRPPLRRDKPVRISFPNAQPRYVYPSLDRSFVFIPRQMRPGGTGYPKGGIVGGGLGPSPRRGHGSFSGHYRDSTYGGSAYGSAYAGSSYAQSNAMSRRSSVVQDNRPDMQNGQPQSRVQSRPIVRLPSNSTPSVPDTTVVKDEAQASANTTTSDSQALFKAALEQQASFSNVNIPMHQPRPQKSVSIENIESPADTYAPYPPVHEFPMPFYNQHSRASSYPSQPSSTPNQLPEQSVHARPFQPNYAGGPPPNGYYIPYPPQPIMYAQHSGPPPPYVPSPNGMSYMPQHNMPHMMPMQPSPMMPMQPQGAPSPSSGAAPGNMIAQESNGMVYYIDPAQYVAPSYPTYPPGPEMYYPPMQMGMPMMGPGQMAGGGQPMYYMP